eukprot:1162034-Pelagomonas_calceolata.AAC.9
MLRSTAILNPAPLHSKGGEEASQALGSLVIMHALALQDATLDPQHQLSLVGRGETRARLATVMRSCT